MDGASQALLQDAGDGVLDVEHLSRENRQWLAAGGRHNGDLCERLVQACVYWLRSTERLPNRRDELRAYSDRGSQSVARQVISPQARWSIAR